MNQSCYSRFSSSPKDWFFFSEHKRLRNAIMVCLHVYRPEVIQQIFIYLFLLRVLAFMKSVHRESVQSGNTEMAAK